MSFAMSGLPWIRPEPLDQHANKQHHFLQNYIFQLLLTDMPCTCLGLQFYATGLQQDWPNLERERYHFGLRQGTPDVGAIVGDMVNHICFLMCLMFLYISELRRNALAKKLPLLERLTCLFRPSMQAN